MIGLIVLILLFIMIVLWFVVRDSIRMEREIVELRRRVNAIARSLEREEETDSAEDIDQEEQDQAA